MSSPHAKTVTEGFLRGLFGENGQGGFVSITDVKLEPRPGKPGKFDWTDTREKFYKLPDEWDRLLKDAEDLVSEAYAARDVYVCPQFLEGRSRKKANATALQVAWAEFDQGQGLPGGLPEPSMVVQSSPGHYHVYWFLSEPVNPFEVEALNKRIAYAFGADKSGWDLSQVLRLPGTTNNKYPDQPKVSVYRFDPGVVYDFGELSALVPALDEPSANGRDQDRDGTPRAGAASEPPIPLKGEDLKVWRGERFATKEDGSGEIDRSGTLYWIGCAIARGLRKSPLSEHAKKAVIAEGVAERDRALGYETYSARRDAAVRYAEIAERALADVATQPDLKVARIAGKKRAAEDFEGDVPAGGAGVKDVLGDLPTDANLHMPPGYEIDEQGVYSITYKHQDEGTELVKVRNQLARAPLLISARTSDIHDGSESTTLLYKRGSEWREHTESRASIAIGRELTKTAAHGVPVTSNNASKVVEYLAEFEAYNLSRLPHTRTTAQLGWLGEGGKSGFLVGQELIGGDVTIQFQGADDGDAQLAAGFSRRGTHKEWLEAIRMLAPYPRVYMALYGSLAPPVLAIVGAPNFGIDWSNPTSTGKTTTLRVGASCWGASDERSPAKALHSWDATRVWIERAAAVLNCLPLILDESKRARYPRAVSQTLYDVANGSGRGRGTPRGLARAGAWTTVLLSTGETPVTSFSEDGGTRARIICLWGPPFGGADEETAAVVTKLRHALDAHYGHAGPMLVEYLAAERASWGAFRALYRDLKAQYANLAGDDPVLGRLGEYFAALALTATLAEQAGIVPEFKDPVARLWDALTATSQEADRAQLALDMVVSWMHSHQAEFYGRHRVDQDDVPIQPSAGWAGRWDRGDSWESVAFMPERLRDVLRRLEHEPDSVLRVWRDRGWLSTDNDRKRMQQRVRLAGERPYMYVIKRTAFDEEARSDVD